MAKCMKSKIQPAALKFNFLFTIGDGSKETNYIDLSQVASIVNRRFYRQGLNWAVSGFKILTQDGVTGQISINKLPNTWVMSNSWEKGFRAWQKMNNEALAESPSVKPKFLDYKIFANKDHHAAGFAANLLPHSSATTTLPIQVATAGEWESSKYIIPDTTSGATGGIQNREVIAVGSSYPGTGASGLGAVSLIEGYASSRGLPNILDPNTPDDAADADGAAPENWLSALFNDGTQQDDQVISDMIAENNLAPYPFENDGTNTDTMYPGGANQMATLEIHSQEFVTGTTIGGTTHLPGGNFPCGLIEIGTFGFRSADDILLEVTMVPGSHRGYLAESMTEM